MSVFITSTSINIPINRDDLIEMGFRLGSYEGNRNKYYYWMEGDLQHHLPVHYDSNTHKLSVGADVFEFITVVDSMLAFKTALNIISMNFDDLWYGASKCDLPGFHKFHKKLNWK